MMLLLLLLMVQHCDHQNAKRLISAAAPEEVLGDAHRRMVARLDLRSVHTAAQAMAVRPFLKNTGGKGRVYIYSYAPYARNADAGNP